MLFRAFERIEKIVGKPEYPEKKKVMELLIGCQAYNESIDASHIQRAVEKEFGRLEDMSEADYKRACVYIVRQKWKVFIN